MILRADFITVISRYNGLILVYLMSGAFVSPTLVFLCIIVAVESITDW